MGIDLTLLPFSYETSSHSVLQLMHRRELWCPIEDIELEHGIHVPDGFMSYLGRNEDGETTFGETLTTPYGERMKYLTAGQLLPLRNHPAAQDNDVNRAVWAYLAELDPTTKVALYWH